MLLYPVQNVQSALNVCSLIQSCTKYVWQNKEPTLFPTLSLRPTNVQYINNNACIV